MAESMEGVSSISRVEIIPGGDGILSAVGGAAVAGRQGVLGVVVVPHQLYHGPHVSHLRSVSALP